MRKILYLLSVMLFITNISCTSLIIPRTVYSSTLDLKKYTDNNFLIIEGTNIGQPYTPIGIVIATTESGYDIKGINITSSNDNIYGEKIEYKKKQAKYIQATLEEAIELLYQEALKSNANAIINLKYDYVPSFNEHSDKWVVSGLAIEIKYNEE